MGKSMNMNVRLISIIYHPDKWQPRGSTTSRKDVGLSSDLIKLDPTSGARSISQFRSMKSCNVYCATHLFLHIPLWCSNTLNLASRDESSRGFGKNPTNTSRLR